MSRSFDWRIFALIAGAALFGAVWAYYNFAGTGGVRNDATVRPLVWAIFATPAATLLGWLAARRREWPTAAFCCFCLYFFTPFVAARIESVVVPAEQVGGHEFYFVTAIVLHLLGALGLAGWRALYEPAMAVEQPPVLT